MSFSGQEGIRLGQIKKDIFWKKVRGSAAILDPDWDEIDQEERNVASEILTAGCIKTGVQYDSPEGHDPYNGREAYRGKALSTERERAQEGHLREQLRLDAEQQAKLQAQRDAEWEAAAKPVLLSPLRVRTLVAAVASAPEPYIAPSHAPVESPFVTAEIKQVVESMVREFQTKGLGHVCTSAWRSSLAHALATDTFYSFYSSNWSAPHA